MRLGSKTLFLPMAGAACLLSLLAAAHSAVAQFDAPAVPIVPQMNMDSAKYGNEHWQSFDFISPRQGRAAPVVVRSEGDPYYARPEQPYLGFLPSFLYENGIAYVSVRPRPWSRGTAVEQAEDLAGAIGEITRNSAKYRVDPARVAVIGAGLEAQTALLLATDPTFLSRAGVPLESLRAAVSVDGEPFDIPSWMAAGGQYRTGKYDDLFGTDAGRQLRLSPAQQVAPPNARRFLFFVSKGKAQLHAQASEMASALVRNGAAAEVLPITRRQPDVAATYLGAPQHQQTRKLLAVLQEAFGANGR
jgi:hypothetical protein